MQKILSSLHQSRPKTLIYRNFLPQPTLLLQNICIFAYHLHIIHDYGNSKTYNGRELVRSSSPRF